MFARIAFASALAPTVLLLSAGIVGCEDRETLEERVLGKDTSSASSATATTSSASAKPKASAKPRKMPPRPVPIGSHGPVQPSDPPQTQMMAIQYTLAMIAPQPGDPVLDRQSIDAVAKKISVGGVTALGEKGHRLLTINMKRACKPDTPKTMAQTRGGVSLKELFKMGVNVVKCHGNKWACHQSTRDPKDVLCHAAPRRR